MKKINNIPVSSKGIMANKYFKIFVTVLLISMLVMSAVLIKVYIEINKKESENNGSSKNIISSIGKNLDEYKVFKDDNGFFGLSGKDDRTVIEPCWNDMYILAEDRFVVSKTFGKEEKMGIIDSESNMLVPFIFESFKPFGNEFIGGFTGEDEKFILFDKDGNSLSDKLWTGCRYSDKIIYLKDGRNEYRGKMIDGEFKYVYINVNSSVNNTSFNISITDPRKIDEIGADNLNRISYITGKYLEYLVSGDQSADISDITSEQYLPSLSSNNPFKDCVIKKISDCNITASENKDSVSYNSKMKVNYDYSKKDIDFKNISSEIIFNIIKDENNRLLLKSINKTEL